MHFALKSVQHGTARDKVANFDAEGEREKEKKYYCRLLEYPRGLIDCIRLAQ